VKEVDDVQPQSVSHHQQMAQLHLLAGFHPLDGAAVQAANCGERLLGHVLVETPHADAVADGPAGLRDPLGQIGWHPTNRLPIKIISQQQI
jgi:hypothetical protein